MFFLKTMYLHLFWSMCYTWLGIQKYIFKLRFLRKHVACNSFLQNYYSYMFFHESSNLLIRNKCIVWNVLSYWKCCQNIPKHFERYRLVNPEWTSNFSKQRKETKNRSLVIFKSHVCLKSRKLDMPW